MKIVTQKTQVLISRLTSLSHVFILALALSLLAGGFYIAQAQSSSTTATTCANAGSSSYYSKEACEYCGPITPSFKNNACKDGWDGKVTDCEQYRGTTIDPTVADDDVVKACQYAKEDKETCTKMAKKETVTKSVHATCPKIDTGTKEEDDGTDDDVSADELEDQIDEGCKKLEESGELDKLDDDSQVKKICENKDNKDDSGTEEEIEELKKEVEALKSAAEAPLPDNQYGQYVNGANKYQAIRVNRATGDNNPALILFHGGGWTSDDGAADKFAPKANERGYTTFVATYRLMTSGIYAQLDDTLRAIQHVRNNAGMYGIDPNRIAVWGDSAGGSLAVRAASTGKTGVKAQVGWSAPTNAYTAVFHSPRAFAAGISHSTCAPNDIADVTDILDQLNNGESSNSSASETNSSSGNLAVDALTLADKAVEASETVEEISSKLEEEEGQTEVSGNARRLATKKLLECIDNFNTGSPALFAKPGSPPGFFAGYDNDPLVHPGQAYQMRDKLRAIGVPAEALILPGLVSTPLNAAIGQEVDGENHLGYHEKFVAPTLDFLDKFVR